MLIDAHVHSFPPGCLPAAMHQATARSWAYQTWPPRDEGIIQDKIEPGFTDPDGSILISDLDAAGIDAAIVMALDHGVAFGQEAPMGIGELLEHYARLRERWAPRLSVFANVDPRRPGAGQLLAVALDEMGYCGAKIYPNGYFVYDDRCRALMGICQDRNVPVLVHTAMSRYPIQGYYADPAFLADTQHLFPDLVIILGHAGAPIWLDHALITAAGHTNTYLEMSHWTRMSYTDPDGLVRVLERARDAVGAHRLLFGSDHTPGPRYSGSRSKLPAMISFMRELPGRSAFTAAEVDLMLGGNAARILASASAASAKVTS